jgi:hypothetical protein
MALTNLVMTVTTPTNAEGVGGRVGVGRIDASIRKITLECAAVTAALS